MRTTLAAAVLVGLVAGGIALPSAAHADSILDTWNLEGFTGSVVVSPDGSTVYVAANSGSDDRIYVLDAADGSEIGRLTGPVWFNFAFGLALSADGSRLYAASESTDQLFAFDTESGAVDEVVATSPDPIDVDIASDGSVLVLSRSGARLDIFEGDSLSLAHSVALTGTDHRAMAVAPDAPRAFVTSGDGSVSVIDVAGGVEDAVVPVAGALRGIAMSPDGSQVAVTSGGGNTLVMLDTETSVTTTIALQSAYAPAFTVDGLFLYVARFTGATVDVFASTGLVVRESIGPFTGSLRQIAMSPVGDRVYVSSSDGSIGVIRREIAPVFITPGGSLADAQVGAPYNVVVNATGMPSPEYTITGGSLPAGITLNVDSGSITGTSTSAGDYSFEVTATSGPNAVSREFTISVTDPTALSELAETGFDATALPSVAALTLALLLGGAAAIGLGSRLRAVRIGDAPVEWL